MVITGWEPISELVVRVQSGKISALSLVKKSLQAISDGAAEQAIISTIEKRALTRAKEIDNQIKIGKRVGRLAGVPFIAKDNFLVFGSPTTAASRILENFNAPYQATAINRLEGEGAICVAKANMDAFALGSSTENSDFMITRNPFDKTRVSGGSSGGSAAAVALGMAPFALGTDTGGSIRQPAAYCGVVGYKPTYGIVSRSGVIAMASSTDVIGPLTKTVEDAALILDCMAGRDKLDSTTIERTKKDYTDFDALDLNRMRIGVVKEFMDEGVLSGVKQRVVTAIEALRKKGAKINEINLPAVKLALACYYIIMPAEVSSNLSRYDGQRFGYSHQDAKDLLDSYEQSRSYGFGSEVKRRIMIGTYVLSSGYYDAYYKRAQQLRTRLIDEFNAAFEKCDILIGPTSPSTAFKIGKFADNPLRMYLTDIMTVAASLIGIPAINIPAGFSNGLPVGLQLMAPQREDGRLLSFAKLTEALVT